ncbi:MAG: nitroreductase [Verrucomicrobia bacterium]|nr:nitroreductase [Verrucomicrobiota bacterium]
MIYFSVNETRCTRCGLCVSDCPSTIIKQEGKSPPKITRRDSLDCIQCQHCLAICPAAAISILKKKPEDSIPLTVGSTPGFEQMNVLLRGRRTVRHYKDENVDPKLLKRILSAVANAPSGVNRHKLTFSVIDDKDVMRKLRERTLSDLAVADKAGRIPEHFGYLKDAPAAYAEDKTDIIFRTAPHALIVSAGPESLCPNEDAVLALAYFELLAQSAGLGTVWWGIFKMLIAALPELKPLIGIPDDHSYCYAMLFGVPAVKYARTVQRDDAAVVRSVRF